MYCRFVSSAVLGNVGNVTKAATCKSFFPVILNGFRVNNLLKISKNVLCHGLFPPQLLVTLSIHQLIHIYKGKNKVFLRFPCIIFLHNSGDKTKKELPNYGES